MSKDLGKENEILRKYSFFRQLRDVWIYGEKYRFQLIFFFILAILAAIFALLPTYLYGRIIDDLTAKKYNFIYTFLLFTALAYLLYHLFRNFISYNIKILAAKIKNKARIKTFDYLFNLDYEYYERASLGQTFSRIESGTSSLRNFIKTLYHGSFTKFFGVVFSVVSLALIDLKIGIYAALIIIFFFGYVIHTGKRMIFLENEINKESEKIYSKVFDFFSHIKIVKLLNIKNKLLGVLDNASEDLIDKEKISRRYERFSVFVDNIFMDFSTVVLLAYLANDVMNSTITIGLAVMVFGFFTKCVSYTQSLWDDYWAMMEQRTGMYRMSLIYGEKPKITEPKNPKKITSWNGLSFNNVYFKYPSKNSESLSDVSFTVKRGERIAIIGLSGSGKSTLSKLLMRLYLPNKGEIKIGNTSINDISYKDLYKTIKIVPQDSELMNASVFENLSLTVDRDVTEQEVLDALKKAAAFDFVKKMPQELNTVVGPDGIKISGGEKQRLCIARAFLSNPEILVFDEATSNLDVLFEKKIHESLKKLSKKITVISITHRLSSLHLYDRVIIMDSGKIVAQSPYKEIAKNRYYHKFLKAMKKKKI